MAGGFTIIAAVTNFSHQLTAAPTAPDCSTTNYLPALSGETCGSAVEMPSIAELVTYMPSNVKSLQITFSLQFGGYSFAQYY